MPKDNFLCAFIGEYCGRVANRWCLLVIAMVVTPGATAYLLTDRFHRLIVISVIIGVLTSFLGAYISYFLDGATGGVIVLLQTSVFLFAFVFAPKHGILANRRRGAHDG